LLEASDTNGLILLVDDGSCEFDERLAVGEQGVVDLTDAWQRIPLQSGSSYTHPLVFTGVLTRQSTAQAVVRLHNVAMDSTGQWSFEVRAEQKSCHFARPPPTDERISYLVLEAGVSEEGWQAGLIRVHDREWRRVSLLRHLHDSNAAPVVVSHVQNYDNRMEFVTTRHHLVPTPLPPDGNIGLEPYQAFFLQVQGEGVWCPKLHYYAEYFGNIDLAGTPIVALCEPTVPDWHWHSCCGGVPPVMEDLDKTLVFSVRWTSRIHTEEEAIVRVSSDASGGSRIMLDDTMVLDVWEDWGSKFTSDPVPTGVGYHHLVYEYRSTDSNDATPTNSYAVLNWVSNDASTVVSSANNTGAAASGAEAYADVGWLACAPGTGAVHGQQLEAGFAPAISSLTTSIEFGARFTAVPMVFFTLLSTGRLGAHLRLLDASEERFSIATEYDTCNFVVDTDRHLLAWIIMAQPTNIWSSESVMSKRSTTAQDVTALLSIQALLGLPDYLLWRNGSDPCSDRWSGIECRVGGGEQLRVVVLDVR
jgi:hypothetical protein